MYLRNSGFAPRRRQGGFIQGAILFALVIIAVVVAAFSLANRDSNNNADAETARVGATLALKIGSDIANGVNRAIADGFAADKVESDLVLTGTVSEGQLSLFDDTLRYAVRPELPVSALASSSTTQPFEETAGDAAFVLEALLGSEDKDDLVLTVPGISLLVCQRVNNLANSHLVNQDPPGTIDAVKSGPIPTGTDNRPQAREGCYSPATDEYSYFRVVLVDSNAAAA